MVWFYFAGGSKKVKGRLPKGTSEYQADWLVNSDGEAEDEIIGSDEERDGSEGDDDQEEDDDNEEMDWEEEKRQLQISKGNKKKDSLLTIVSQILYVNGLSVCLSSL